MRSIPEGPTVLDVSLPLGGVTLRGELLLPPSPRGLTLLSFAGNAEQQAPPLRDVARYLRKAHYGTLLVDLLSAEQDRDDDWQQSLAFDVQLLSDRLERATEWLLGSVAGMYGRVALVGVGTAAAAALVASVRLGDAVRAVATIDGRVDLAGGALDWVTAHTLLLVAGRDDPTLLVTRAAVHALRGRGTLEVISGADALGAERWALHAAAHSARDWFERYLPRIETGMVASPERDATPHDLRT